MVIKKSATQVIAEEAENNKAKADAENAVEQESQEVQKISNIVQTLRTKWERARLAKTNTVEQQMFKNLRQFLSKYDLVKAKQIADMGGSDVFIQITDTKCRNMISWIKDILFQPNSKPFGVQPTSSPKLSDDMMASIKQKYVKQAMQKMMASGEQFDVNTAVQQIQDQMPALEHSIEREVRDQSEEKARDIEREIDDKLIRGGWYDALADTVFDLVVLKNGFIKGPIKRYRNIKKITKDQASGIEKMDYVKEIVSEWERRPPWDIYPEPDSNGIDDGYLFDHVSYRRRDLASYIGVPNYKEEEIRAVLKEHRAGGLREWTGIESERWELEGKDTGAVWQSDKIEGLEFYGDLPGSDLIEWGITEIKDPDIDYACSCILIGNHVISAVVNHHPEGRKPFSTTSFEEQADSFWGHAFTEKLPDVQAVCNACARAIINNIGMGSGPQTEINVDRLVGGLKGDMRLIPWKKWLTTNRQMQMGQAINFWQPQMHAQEILTVYSAFSKIADERGIPSYAHGDPQVGGGGNTASGLSMLITQASRAIKSVVRNIDDHLIKPSVRDEYSDIISDPKYIKKIGDVYLVAKGSSVLIEKEQRAVRMLEFLAATNNDLDAQITGIKGRAYLLGEVARAHEIDADKALSGMFEAQENERLQQINPQPAGQPGAEQNSGTPEKPTKNVDLAGNKPQGFSTQAFHESGGHPALPEK